MITVSQFKTKIAGKMHGTTLGKITDVYGKLQEGAGNVLLRLDPPSTKRRARIDNAIYDKVYNYAAPSDIKGADSVLDIRPVSLRSTDDEIYGTFERTFDIKKPENTFVVETVNGVKTLRLSKALLPARMILHSGDTLTLEGAVTALSLIHI